MDQKIKDRIFKNYNSKINDKKFHLNNSEDIAEIDLINPSDINNLIVLLNWCFQTKNNFFVKQFNKGLVHSINGFYNQFKTNILLTECTDIFDKITHSQLKTIKFIVNQYINIYDEMKNTPNNIPEINELCSLVTKDSMKKLIIYINSYATNL